MLQLHPSMDARRFSFFSVQFNSCGKAGVRQPCTNSQSLMGKCYSRRGIVMMSKKDTELQPDIDEKGEEGLWSVIIPTYNRLPILSKCLKAVEEQRNYEEAGIKEYEVIVVDDGSTDGTLHFLLSEDEGHPSCEECIRSSKRFPHVKVLQQSHGGAARARNLGFLHSRGSVIVFIDSDLVVTPDFLKEHARVLYQCFLTDGDDATFTYGRVVNTHNFENPQSEPFKITDISTAFFATGNIAISRSRLAQAAAMLSELSEGPFDTNFSEYGWEDLELGVRLKKVGAKLKHAPAAVGYHWHPSFSYDQLPMQIEQVGDDHHKFGKKKTTMFELVLKASTKGKEWEVGISVSFLLLGFSHGKFARRVLYVIETFPKVPLMSSRKWRLVENCLNLHQRP